MNVAVIKYNAGNIRSVDYALKRLGVEAVITADKEVLQAADKVIFPGVGEAETTMKHLRASRMDELIKNLRQPVLGICLGMQLMCRFSEEENTWGLGIFPMEVKKFTDSCKVPHMGWNTVRKLKTTLFQGINPGEWMYFVHSYYVPVTDYCIATCDYQCSFAAAICKNNFYGCQFHPEKSAGAGEKIIKNFLDIV